MGYNGDKVLLVLAVAWFKKEGYLYLCPYFFIATSYWLHTSTDGISSAKFLSLTQSQCLSFKKIEKSEKKIS